MHFTLPQLITLDTAYPTQRKLLLVPNINCGRELLAALALRQGSWIGWDVATLAGIAERLAVMALAERQLRRASDVAIADAVSGAFDEAASAKELSPSLSDLAWSAGTRSAITDAVLELRTAGATSATLHSIVGNREQSGSVSTSLAAILARFERLLGERNLADASELFRAALQAFDEQSSFVLDHALLVCTPGWVVRGLSRQLLSKLVGRGLKSLAPVDGLDLDAPEGLVELIAPRHEKVVSPDAITSNVTMFCAATPGDEMRAVMRRVAESGLSIDSVEVASTDRDVYGVTLEALCSQLGANQTSLDGLPLIETRVGRALGRWLNWIEGGFQVEELRGALESKDFVGVAGDAGVRLGGPGMAAELRALRIGWGLETTRRAAKRLRTTQWQEKIKRLDDEPEARFAARKSERIEAMKELAGLLDVLIDNAPTTIVSVPDFARRTISVLALVQPDGDAERSTLERLVERLTGIAAIARAPSDTHEPVATLRQELSDLRAWTSTSNTSKPRRATGAHLHFTNLENAGATGRPLLFLVGLDADRCAGPVLQSSLLPDSLRLRLNEQGTDLATTEQRRRERAWQLAVAVIGTQSKLFLSYATSGGADGRDASPAPMLLQIARRAHNDESFSYERLRGLLGSPATPIPANGEASIDARDVWFATMSDGALLLDARPVAFEMFDGLRQGQHAVTERSKPAANAYHGLVPAVGKLDPRKTTRAISPSSLETIAACSLRWFYSVALNARVPDEPEFDALTWLNALDRGRALHEIYERIMNSLLHEQTPGTERRRKIERIVNDVVEKMEREIPAPSEIVKARELADLHNNAQLFVTTEHNSFVLDPWEVAALEMKFGDDAAIAEFPLDDGSTARVRGRVDRVDKLRNGTLRLIDYKTGRAFELDTKKGAFDGGRKLQLALYSPAVSAKLNAPVSVAEYRFPTEKGDGAVARADVARLASAPRIVRSLLDDVGAGRFLPTIKADDCKYCDYNAVCRVRKTRWTFTSPRANWAKDASATDTSFVEINRRAKTATEDE